MVEIIPMFCPKFKAVPVLFKIDPEFVRKGQHSSVCYVAHFLGQFIVIWTIGTLMWTIGTLRTFYMFAHFATIEARVEARSRGHLSLELLAAMARSDFEACDCHGF